MYKIRRLLIALDFSEIDETLIKYVSRVSKTMPIDKIYFLHTVKSLELPSTILKKYPDLVAPKDEAVKKQIEFIINDLTNGGLQVDYDIDIVEGVRAESILKWAKIKEIDLIVLGKKSDLKGSGTMSGKIARTAPCSVLFVPEVMPETVGKLVVPIDFTVHSQMALEQAIELASSFEKASIHCVNVYEVPQGYHKSGKDEDEFAEILKKLSEESFDTFIDDIDFKNVAYDFTPVLDKEGDTTNAIYQFAVQQQASAILIGSKGRTKAASLILGSIAEKLIKLNSKIPLAIIKKRNDNLDIFDVIMKT